MPAAVRGGRRGAAGSRTKSSAAPDRPRLKRAHKSAPRPRRAKGPALSPKFAAAAVGVVVIAGAVLALATGGRAQTLGRLANSLGAEGLGGLGFRIETVHLQGATPVAQKAILKAAGLAHGGSILALDLDGVRKRVEQVGWVSRARVIRLWPDTVVIAVDQRPLVAIWEHNGRAVVVATDGTVVGRADPNRFAALPLIVGDGANLAAAAIIPAVSARPRLADRLEALVRVDDRRWDLRLKDGALIQLPAGEEQAALIRLDQLDRKSRILDLALARIDLRDPEMVVVRPRTGPAPNLASRGV